MYNTCASDLSSSSFYSLLSLHLLSSPLPHTPPTPTPIPDDVHFYAGFALASLWPRLELSLQHDITVATLTDDESSRLMLADNAKALRKPFGVVPHDVGDPSGHPYVKLNAYLFQDVANWKDLGSKYVLQVYRNVSLGPGETKTLLVAREFELTEREALFACNHRYPPPPPPPMRMDSVRRDG